MGKLLHPSTHYPQTRLKRRGIRSKELAALDRYERRALSRRKFAVRAFDAALVESKG